MAEPSFIRTQEAGNPKPIGKVGRPTGSGVGKTHGTVATYAIGCRCVDCRAAKRLYSRKNKSHQVSRIQRDLAVRYVHENLPHTWARLRLEAEEQFDARRVEDVNRP